LHNKQTRNIKKRQISSTLYVIMKDIDSMPTNNEVQSSEVPEETTTDGISEQPPARPSSSPNNYEESDTRPSSSSTSTITAESANANINNTTLSRREKWNVTLLVLSFSCVVALLTLIVGTGAVVITSVGGSSAISPFALACFFVGMAIVSLFFTHWLFDKYSRKYGFWMGCTMSIVGSVVAIGGLLLESPAIVLIADVILGMGTGVAMYLRFAAVEVVSVDFAPKAVTWTLCGGCLAAFVGPEIAESTKGAFSNTEGDNLTYLGVFIVAVAFALAEAIFVGFIEFNDGVSNTGPSKGTVCQQQDTSGNVESTNVLVDHSGDVEMLYATKDFASEETHPVREDNNTSNITVVPGVPAQTTSLRSVLRQSSFRLPVLVSILSWVIMAMPMSMLRVSMREVGFSDRQSLTVIELHFLSMYMPGFWSGSIISRIGHIRACYIAVGCSLVATAINLSTQDNTTTTTIWFLGLIFLGIGWNFGFSSATVWVQRVYAKPSHQHLKAKIQAANEFFTFFFSGGLIFSTGYINEAGGGGLAGWRLLNVSIMVFIIVLIVVMCVATRIDKLDKDDVSQDGNGRTEKSDDK
jgi:MFS family permease